MPVNLSDPLGAKARFALWPAESLNELITGTARGGSSGSTVSTVAGLAFLANSSATTWAVVEDDLDPFVSGDFTIHWYGLLRDNTTSGILRTSAGSYGWQLFSQAYNNGDVSLAIYSDGTGDYSFANVVPITDDTVHSFMMRYTHATTTVDWFFDNAPAGSGTWAISPGAMGPTQNFSITGFGAKPHAVVILNCFAGALSDAEIARLYADQAAIFAAPAIDLAGANCTQENTSSSGVIGIVGVLFGSPCVQANTSSSGAITRVQALTGANSAQANTCSTGSIDPYARLKALLNPKDQYTWTNVELNSFDDAVIPTSDNGPSQGGKRAVIYAWSSFDWDQTRGNLIAFGGGHANYLGNEVYIWNGETGLWGLASLPSFVDYTDINHIIPSKDAPQSSHTYQNNVFLKNQELFVSFGGAAASAGGCFLELVTSSPRVTRNVAPWVFDVSKANPTKIGGATGSGWDTTTVKLGSNAWYNRRDYVDGDYPIDTIGHINQAAVAVDEDGVDVVYMTMDLASGLPNWYRYEFGDVRGGGRDTCTKIAETANSAIWWGMGVFDTTRSMFYRVSQNNGGMTGEIAAIHVLTATGTTHDTPINVEDSGGTPFVFNASGKGFGGVYDADTDRIWMWDSDISAPLRIYYIQIPAWDISTGWASTTWVAHAIDPAGTGPHGNHLAGVLGKIKYVPALKSLVVLDSAQDLWEPSVWMFKLNGAEYHVVGAGSTQGNACSTAGIIQTQLLARANSSQANTCSTGSIAATPIDLICAPSVQDNIASASAIVQAHMLLAAGSTQHNNASPGSITSPGTSLPTPASRTLNVSENRILGVRS